jgi:hypothetical protein
MIGIVNHHVVRRREFSAWSPAFIKEINHNLGNSFISETLLKILPGAKLHEKLSDLENYSDPIEAAETVNKELKKCVFVAQDHLLFDFMPPSKSLDGEKILRCAKFLSQLRVPTYVVSLTMRKSREIMSSIESLMPESIELLKAFRNPYILVGTRGYQTNNLLREFGGITTSTVGCPSFYSRNVHLTREINLERIGTNGRFVNLNDSTIHIAQGDDHGEPLLLGSIKGDGKIYATEAIKNSLSEFYGYNFIDKIYFPASTKDWRVVTEKLTLVAGTRLHGAIMALTLGIPAITTATDIRALETLEFMRLPYFNEPNLKTMLSTASEDKNLFRDFDEIYREKREHFNSWIHTF